MHNHYVFWYSDPTYEAWKRIIAVGEIRPGYTPILPMRHGNLQYQSHPKIETYNSDPTYEAWKRESLNPFIYLCITTPILPMRHGNLILCLLFLFVQLELRSYL